MASTPNMARNDAPPQPVDDRQFVDVVIPTVGRPCVQTVLAGLAAERFGGRVFLVDDRRQPHRPLLDTPPAGLDTVVVRSGGRGPAAARNVGWRASGARWIAFLDDDVELVPGWGDQLLADLDVPPDVAATQAQLHVPLPLDRRPTDWERNVAGLETAQWITADMAYRRRVLREVGGFDERFPRAYREDADLALRVVDAGYRIVRGSRSVHHPVRPAPWYVSIAKQAGNADDALMRRLHGPTWRARSSAPAGAFRGHIARVLALGTGAASLAAGRHRTATAALALWSLLTGRFAWKRIAPGPRTVREAAAMVATSIAIPPVALWHRARGVATRVRPRPPEPAIVEAVLLDRDGTLIDDVPYNGDPGLVTPAVGAREALDRLRGAGIRVGIVSNQSGVGRGLITLDQVQRVNARVDELLGPFDVVEICPHDPAVGCDCRKPAPGLVHRAAAALDVRPDRCVVIGDIGADVAAATAAGAGSILVPNGVTRAEEVATAPRVAADLETAVDLVLGGAHR